jgi:hypothetical protein
MKISTFKIRFMAIQHNYTHIETFDIAGTTIKIGIRFDDRYYHADLLQGYTGTGDCTGPASRPLTEIIAAMKKQHTYSYHFFECGCKQPDGIRRSDNDSDPVSSYRNAKDSINGM